MGDDKCSFAGIDNHTTGGKATESTSLNMNSLDIDKISHDIAGVSIGSAVPGEGIEGTENMAPSTLSPSIAPSVQHGWLSISVSQSYLSGSSSRGASAVQQSVARSDSDESIEDGDQLIVDYDDDSSEEYHSVMSDESFESRKRSTWFRSFFETLDRLPIEEITKSTRIWHCPACKGGPRAIVWHKGLQSLIAHSKTKTSKRAKLHWDFAELLEEELQRKGVSVLAPGELFGKWKGLQEDTIDHKIVWPPMVLVMNTLLEQDDADKWIGMGNQELLNYFKVYEPIKTRHSYGPHGHRGMSILIFDASAVGYLQAELLHKHFAAQGIDRDAWEHGKMYFCPDGKRQLYGFLATEKDLDNFNKHSQRKRRLKFEMASYQKMVMNQIKNMREDGWQLHLLKYELAQQDCHKSLEESHRLKEPINDVPKITEKREFSGEWFLQEEHNMLKPADCDHPVKEGHRLRIEKEADFVNDGFKGAEDFDIAREQLMQEHEWKKSVLRCWYLAEEAELENNFIAELNKLREKYVPRDLTI